MGEDRQQGGQGGSEGDGCVYLRLLGSLAGDHVYGKERWPRIPQGPEEPGWGQCVVGGVRGRPQLGSYGPADRR